MAKYVKKTDNPNMGAPRKEIDWDEFDRLCELHCTLTEIAAWFKVSEDTIERRVNETHCMTFAEYYKIKSANGKSSLRRMQYKAAMAGNTAMLIWLGKQLLGQHDRQETYTTTTFKPVVVELDNGRQLELKMSTEERKADFDQVTSTSKQSVHK